MKPEEKLKKERDKLTTYLQAAPYGIAIINEDGCFLEVNQAFVEIIGYSEEELLEMSIYDLFSANKQQTPKLLFDKAKEEGELNEEITFINLYIEYYLEII